MGRLADRQFGVVSHAQLRAAGLSRDVIDRRRRRGALRLLHREVYAVGHVALTEEARRLAAVLACGADAVLSHRSAAVAWGLISAPGDLPYEVSVVARHSRSRPGIRVHRVGAIAVADLTRHRGVPITTPPRTMVDVAAELSDRELERAFDEGRVQRLLSPASVQAALERSPHGRGAAALRALLGQQGSSTATRSELEERFLALIRRAGLPAPQVNARVGAYTVDFLWAEQGLAVELDGYRFHSTRSAFERDREKDLALRRLGLEALRFTYRQVEREPETVLVAVVTGLMRRRAG